MNLINVHSQSRNILSTILWWTAVWPRIVLFLRMLRLEHKLAWRVSSISSERSLTLITPVLWSINISSWLWFFCCCCSAGGCSMYFEGSGRLMLLSLPAGYKVSVDMTLKVITVRGSWRNYSHIVTLTQRIYFIFNCEDFDSIAFTSISVISQLLYSIQKTTKLLP